MGHRLYKIFDLQSWVLRLSHRSLKFAASGCLLLCGVLSMGCTPPPEFRLNRVELMKQERLNLPDGEYFEEDYQQQIRTILLALFGTPDQPRFPMLTGEKDLADDVLSLKNLEIAAGPVKSDKEGVKSGLYREHCAHCHGITGDGAGPTAAFLNPYPRDFRLGKFKFKSTPLRQPPTDHDLKTILTEGIPGTAMPSFRTMAEAEIDALVDYVKYLTIRGQFERFLMSELIGLDGKPLVDFDLLASQAGSDSTESSATAEAINKDSLKAFEEQTMATFGEELLDGIVNRWLERETKVTKIPPALPALATTDAAHADLVNSGSELFFTKGNCAQCHGMTGVGDGQVASFDDWTVDWLKTSGVDPDNPQSYREFLKAGALPPRSIRPRNLRVPVYRGGVDPEKLYLRIANGIEGTPMPASTVLTPEETWAIVAYVMSLGIRH